MDKMINNNIMKFEGNDVEVFEWNGKVLFNPKHVAKCLDIKNVNDNITKMNDKQVIRVTNSNIGITDFRKIANRGENFLTESGVYKLIFKSKKAEAERFQDWVTDEVLPSIRQTGGYIPIAEEDDDATIMARALLIAQKTIDKKNKELEEANRKIIEDKPKVEFHDAVTKSEKSISVGDFAKIVYNENIKLGRNRMFQWLREDGYLMYNNEPFQSYIERGYFEYKEIVLSNGNISGTTYITPKGQVYLTKKLKEYFNK